MEKNSALSHELETSRTQLNATVSELEEMKSAPMYFGKDKKLEEEVKKQAEDIKSLKAQLLEAQQETQRLKGGIFGMFCELSELFERII